VTCRGPRTSWPRARLGALPHLDRYTCRVHGQVPPAVFRPCTSPEHTFGVLIRSRLSYWGEHHPETVALSTAVVATLELMRTVDGTLSVSILATRNVSDNPCAWIEDVRTTRSRAYAYGDCLWAVELEIYELTSLLTSLRAYLRKLVSSSQTKRSAVALDVLIFVRTQSDHTIIFSLRRVSPPSV
jgi:hypothetical protein